MNKHIPEIIELLKENYGTAKCYLNYKKPWQLLVATILSAQCTDERVNLVTKDLFKKYKKLEDLAAADVKELEKDIYSTGFYKNKAKNIKACAEALLRDYDGIVPSDINELTSLPGVGRKTANVVRGEIFKIPSVVVDTHVGRISRKLGFTKNEDPVKVEKDLMKCIPEDYWIDINLQLIAHGRAVCTARKPDCENCFLGNYCPSKNKILKERRKNTAS